MRCAVKCFVFMEIFGEFETFSTSSALRAPSPQGEGFGLCRPVKLRSKSKLIWVASVQFTLSVATRHLSQRERQGRVQNRQTDRFLVEDKFL